MNLDRRPIPVPCSSGTTDSILDSRPTPLGVDEGRESEVPRSGVESRPASGRLADRPGTEVESTVEGSAAHVAATSRAAFVSTHTKPCSCPWELRAERGGLECARCGSPVRRREAA
jgi:hypothetical protein